MYDRTYGKLSKKFNAFLTDIFLSPEIHIEPKDELFEKIAVNSVDILRKNSYNIPSYIIRDNMFSDAHYEKNEREYQPLHDDVSAYKSPDDIIRHRQTLFIHKDKKSKTPSYEIYFYNAGHVPGSAQTQLIHYLIDLHREQGCHFDLYLRIMASQRIGKLLGYPPATRELTLHRTTFCDSPP